MMSIYKCFGQVINHTFLVCIILHCISISCNFNRIHQPSNVFKNITPKGNFRFISQLIVSNFESYGFIANLPGYGKYKYSPQKYANFDNLEIFTTDSEIHEVNHHGLEPCYLKRPETQLSKVVLDEKNLSPSQHFSSKLKYLNQLFSKNDFLKGLNSFSLVGLYYLGSSLNEFAKKKVHDHLPLTPIDLSMSYLFSVPFLSFNWLFGLTDVPKFYLPQYNVEKVDFKVDGVLVSVKKSLKNGLNKLKAAVKAHKTVLVQSGYVLLMRLLLGVALMDPGLIYLSRALEPVFMSLLSYYFENYKLDKYTYMSLAPVVLGVALSTHRYLEFSPVPVVASLSAYLVYYLKRMESKRFFSQNMDKVGKNITHENVNTLVSIVSSLMLSIIAWLDKDQLNYFFSHLSKKLKAGDYELLKYLIVAGFTHALIHKTSFELLSNLSPVSHAVASSLKPVMTRLLDSVFNDLKLTKNELYGSAMAIAGTLLYSYLNN